MPILHVSLKSMEILAEMTADVANNRRSFTVVLLHVVIQGLLYFELLATCVTRVVIVARMQPDVMILQGALIITLVFAYAAFVYLLPVILLNVGVQITAKAEGFWTIGAFVPVLLQMLGEVALFQELAMTVIAFYIRCLPFSQSILFGYDPRTKSLSRLIRFYVF